MPTPHRLLTAQSVRTAAACLAVAVLLVGEPLARGHEGDGEWNYREVTLAELDLGTEVPGEAWGGWVSPSENGRVLATALTGARMHEGEAYLWLASDESLWSPPLDRASTSLRLRVPAGRESSGELHLIDTGGRPPSQWRLRSFRFQVPDVARECSEHDFLEARRAHLSRIEALGLPGQAWFHASRADLDRVLEPADPLADRAPGGNRPLPESDLDSTLELFSGRRALRETLQTERMRDVESAGEGDAEPVSVDSLPGITVPAYDWAARLGDSQPVVEPLASWVPHDQLLVSFSSFVALAELIDELEQRGPALVQFLEERGQDARTRERLERQLCVELNQLVRWMGPRLVRSVAITCSDPYLREGTDLTLLLETVSPEPVLALLDAQREQRRNDAPGAVAWSGTVAGAEVLGVQDADRRLSSYRAALGDVVAISNSLPALERVLQTWQGAVPSHAGTDEYRFFRTRYPFEPESRAVLGFLSDAFLRRFCGPSWRIAESRRLRCAAAMEDAVARRVLRGGPLDESKLRRACPSGGEILAGEGFEATCSLHGTPEFLTPIAETPVEWVTPGERDAYTRFRDQYQSFWRRFFDPVAVEIRTGDRLAMDLTVLPLIEGTDYDDLREISGGEGALTDADGDPHDEALLHWIVHINKESAPVREIASMLSVMPGFEQGPLRWMGDSLEVFVDRDAVQSTLADTDDLDEWVNTHLAELPVALRVPVRDPVHLGLFLVALRAMADSAATDLLHWENRTHHDAPYVVISGGETAATLDESFARLKVCYAVTGGGFYVTLSEDLLKRAIDRSAARKAEQAPPRHDWLGDNTGLRVHLAEAMPMLNALLDPVHDRMLTDCTRNFPALIEWRRLFPGEDPVLVHERLWHVRPVCPVGGTYSFDDEAGWPVCSVHGNPGEPRRSHELPTALQGLDELQIGLTFEEDGLRLRAILDHAR